MCILLQITLILQAVKLQVGALSGIRSFSVVVEADSVKSCMVNFEDVQIGDNNPQGRLELVQCINPNVRLTRMCSYNNNNIIDNHLFRNIIIMAV